MNIITGRRGNQRIVDIKEPLSIFRQEAPKQSVIPKKERKRLHPSQLFNAYEASMTHLHQLLCEYDSTLLPRLNATILLNWNYTTCGHAPKFVLSHDTKTGIKTLKIKSKDFLWPNQPDNWHIVHEMMGYMTRDLIVRPYMTHPSWNIRMVRCLRYEYLESVKHLTSRLQESTNLYRYSVIKDAVSDTAWVRYQIKQLGLGGDGEA